MFINTLFKIHKIPILICLTFLLGWVGLLEYKYLHLGYYDWDLAFYTQACWQLLHGSQYTSMVGINYFGDHSYFITLLILPFFAIASSPVTLICLKIVAFVISAFLLYKIAYKKAGEAVALVFMVLYFLFPANVFSLLYEFNPESLAPPLLFWMFMAFEDKRWRSFFVAAGLLMLIKENMALIVGAFGGYGLLNKNYPKKTAGIIVLLSAAIFLILALYVIPHFRNLPYHPFVVRYEYLGHNVGEILTNVLTRPDKVLGGLLTKYNGQFIYDLFGPLLIPALFSVHLMFFVFPILLQHLLSTASAEHSIYYHYGATITPFIFLATLQTFVFCRNRFNLTITKGLLVLLVVLCVFHLNTYAQRFNTTLAYHKDNLESVRWAFIQAIPPGESVIATFDYLAPLSLRDNLYAFHKIYNDYYQNPKKIRRSELNLSQNFILPDHVRWALIDLQDPWLQQELSINYEVTNTRVRNFLDNHQWRLVAQEGSILLLKRNPSLQ